MVQKLVFVIVSFIWPSPEPDEPTLVAVAGSNAQAKNISTTTVKARTIHNAAALRVQKYTLDRMAPGKKQAQLTRTWDHAMVLVIEEVSMVGAPLCNALSYRSACGRSRTHDVSPSTYSQLEGGVYKRAFGRVPIVIFLGDFLQLPPTAMTSLIDDPNAKKPDGTYRHAEPPSCEVQHACKLFQRIPHVFELQGTKRFVSGDPLIQFLRCMRATVPAGQARFPPQIWHEFEKTFATDTDAALDPRHSDPRFVDGYGMAIYWEPLVRWTFARTPSALQMGGGTPPS